MGFSVMPSVLITRPKIMSETLAATLQGLGYETVIEPLLSITPLSSPSPHTSVIDAVMITSGNALLVLQDRQSEITGLLDILCFCVGSRTAKAAEAFGFRRVLHAAGDGSELAGLIHDTSTGRSFSILHIAGRDVSGAARQRLEEQGHRVTEWPVYDAIPAPAFTPATRTLFSKQGFNAVVVFSPKTARVLNGLLAQAEFEACCARLAAICLSEAVACELKTLPWRHLLSSPRPTEEAIIACLQTVCPVKP
jgi:uroporphyrinogen-III synthase